MKSSLPSLLLAVAIVMAVITAVPQGAPAFDHDYRQYAPLVTSSQRPTPQEFQNGFGSSTDSHARLTRLVPTATGVAATVKFTSHQSPSASPTGTSCTSWRITLFLQPHGGGYRIGPAAPGYHAHFRAC